MPKVLLVENNVLNRKMLERQLKHSGYEVLIATDGDKGVSLAINQQPDLVIMDTDLPVMDGWQAIKILKASVLTSNIPVIALTTNTKSGNWKTALEVGCNDYDTKPIVLKRLLGKIEALLGLNSAPATEAPVAPVDATFTPMELDAPTFPIAAMDSIAPFPSIGRLVKGLLNNRYQIVQTLKKDEFEESFLAKDTKVAAANSSVLIKAFELPADNPPLLAMVRDFLNSEMGFLQVISRQDDIATYLDHFEEKGVFYWVQEYVAGKSLTTELGSAQSMGYVLKLTHSLLSNIHPFHQGQIAHCRCHPNSFVRRQSDDRIVLVEYGVLTRLFVRLRSHSLAYRQAILKQRQYQAVEQRVGNPQLNNDVYSIGMIVLQSLTGQSPEWLVSAISQHSLTDLVNADPKVVKLFERMVSPNQHLRFQSAGEALASLPLGLIPKKPIYQQQAFSS